LFESSKVVASDLLGLGACTVDILAVIDHFPKGRETQLVQQLILEGGGPVATAVYTFAKLGGRSGIIDRFDSEDWRAKAILDEFQKLGVSLKYAKFDGKGKSSLSNILIEKNTGDRAICFSPGSVADITEDEIDQTPLDGVKVVHLNGRHPVASFRLAERARSIGITISFDGGAQRYSEVTDKLAALSDICIVAEEFSKHICSDSVQESARAIQSMGPKIVGITQGRQGSWFLLDNGDSFHQPAFLTDRTVDTTGCGDSFHGAFLYAYCQGWDVRYCAKFASAVASINSQCLGGRGGLPTLKQVEKFLADHSVSRST
jgi:sugar/nucleoside kinase (ribokinase family)